MIVVSPWEIVIVGLIFLISAVCVPLVVNRFHRPSPGPEPIHHPPTSLNDPAMREHLRILLTHYNIGGDCDIRDGKVHPAIRTGERNSIAASIIGVYNRAVEQTQNPNLMLFVHRSDGRPLPLELDLSALRQIAQILEDANGR